MNRKKIPEPSRGIPSIYRESAMKLIDGKIEYIPLETRDKAYTCSALIKRILRRNCETSLKPVTRKIGDKIRVYIQSVSGVSK